MAALYVWFHTNHYRHGQRNAELGRGRYRGRNRNRDEKSRNDTDSDPDSDNAVQAALSGSPSKAPALPDT
jgi:hypothetical protein